MREDVMNQIDLAHLAPCAFAPFSPLIAVSGVVIVLVAILVFLLVVAVWWFATYNGLVRKKQACRESWADIDVELKRRHDLIPNLVSTVKGYASHESGVLTEVTKLRDQAVADQSGDQQTRGEVESKLSAGIGQVLMRAEAYPDLKASDNFLQLQKELEETETRIERARRFYNANARSYQVGCQVFPSSIVAGAQGFPADAYQFFKLDDPSEAAAVKVDFGAGNDMKTDAGSDGGDA